MNNAPDLSKTLKPDPKRIVVPRRHGEVLVEPPMPALIAAPRVFPDAGEAAFLGMPRWAVAETARGEWLDAINMHGRAIGAAELLRSAEELPWIVTGHQAEFYHAGVWAKVVATDHIAQASKGLAIDMIVDHDVIDELGFDVPARVAGQQEWNRDAVIWAESPGLPADALKSPTIEQFEHWDSELGDLPATHIDTLGHVLADLRPRGEGGEEPYSLWMSRARHHLEQSLGLQVHHVPTSLLCDSTTWLLFVLSWMRSAAEWTASYNRQLAAYRARNGIKSAMHPMPDLARRQIAEQCWEIELPFWIYSPSETRERLTLRIEAASMKIMRGSELIELTGCDQPSAWDSVQALKKVLRWANAVIRPRALTLTMYVRLFVSDLFIHGIGGALYDQITDGIMLELFNITSPYACVSAAWLLLKGEVSPDARDMSELLHERHHLVHNPQRGIDPFTSLRTEIAELLRNRRELVEKIRASQKEDRHAGRAARAEMFARLHATNAALHDKVPRVLQRLDEEIAQAGRDAARNKVLLWREYYFALHPTESLRQLIARITGEK